MGTYVRTPGGGKTAVQDGETISPAWGLDAL
jgi:hypothetical protein